MKSALDILIPLIKEFEGCSLTAYKCPAGVWTIGYGYTGPDVKEGCAWTQARADDMLLKYASRVFKSALDTSPVLQYQTPEKQAAIADFIYNCGLDAYKKSTLKKRVDATDWPGAIVELKKWNKGGGKVLKGLVRRRQREAELLC